jgi:hypothetical protein
VSWFALLWRRAASQRTVLAAAFTVILVATALLATLGRFTAKIGDVAVRSEIASASASRTGPGGVNRLEAKVVVRRPVMSVSGAGCARRAILLPQASDLTRSSRPLDAENCVPGNVDLTLPNPTGNKED